MCNALLHETSSPLGTDGATKIAGDPRIRECQAQLHLKTRFQTLKLNVLIDNFYAQTCIIV